MRPRREVTRQNVGVRIDRAILAAAETAADDQHRTLTNLIELALIEWLERNGYLSSDWASKR
jgi:hypothetical protein